MAYPRRFFIRMMGEIRKMTMTRITINLLDQEKTALRALAENDFREPRAQAALIIRRELIRLGLLAVSSDSSKGQKVKLGGNDAKS